LTPGGVRNISNCLSIGTEFDLTSKNLELTCAENGWWDRDRCYKTPFRPKKI
jgi:hypothetical protein